jgi:hypothetical protein
MLRKPVISSNLQSVGYDSTTYMLEIKFHDGSIYQYSKVPESIYKALMNANSHGKFFHAFIKSYYPCKKVS